MEQNKAGGQETSWEDIAVIQTRDVGGLDEGNGRDR